MGCHELGKSRHGRMQAEILQLQVGLGLLAWRGCPGGPQGWRSCYAGAERRPSQGFSGAFCWGLAQCMHGMHGAGGLRGLVPPPTQHQSTQLPATPPAHGQAEVPGTTHRPHKPGGRSTAILPGHGCSSLGMPGTPGSA